MRAIRASREQQAALQQLQAQQLGAAMHERPPGTAQRSSYGSGLTHPEHDPKNSVMRSLIYGGDETGAGAPRGPRVQPHQGERPLGVDPASAQARAFHEQQLARAFQSHGAAAFVQGNSALPPAGVSHPHARGAAPAQVTPPRAPPPGNEVAALRAQVAQLSAILDQGVHVPVPYPTAGGGPPEVAMLHVRFGASEPEQLHVPGSRWHWHFSSPHVSPSVAATDTIT